MRWPPWTANAVSVIRIGLVPVWVWAAGAVGPEPALLVLGLIGVSDVLDGYLARRLNLTSKQGATIDAVADKVAQIIVLTTLALWTIPGFASVPLWFMALLIFRDAVLTTGILWIWFHAHRVQAPHYWHGKVSAILIFVLMVALHLNLPSALLLVGFQLEAALLVLSTVHYAIEGIKILRRPAA